MIGIGVKIDDQTPRVKRAADRASFENIGHALANIRKSAIKSIKTLEGPSDPGTPIHTHLPARKMVHSIFYSVEKDRLSGLVGPVASKIKTIGEVHEFGKKYMGAKYPERSFMGPALEANADRMPSYWLHSVGE